MTSNAWTRAAWNQVDRGSAKFLGRFRFTIEDCLYAHGMALADEIPAPSTSGVDLDVQLFIEGRAGLVAVRENGEQASALLLVRGDPDDGDESAVLAYPVGECRYCGRLAPLGPGANLGRDWRQGRFSIPFGTALIDGEPDAAHKCPNRRGV